MRGQTKLAIVTVYIQRLHIPAVFKIHWQNGCQTFATAQKKINDRVPLVIGD
jgi:hypothetical protein